MRNVLVLPHRLPIVRRILVALGNPPLRAASVLVWRVRQGEAIAYLNGNAIAGVRMPYGEGAGNRRSPPVGDKEIPTGRNKERPLGVFRQACFFHEFNHLRWAEATVSTQSLFRHEL